MKAFKHHNSRSLEEAIELLSTGGGQALPMAGGTDLLGTLKDGIHDENPDLLVNLKTIPELNGIEEREDGLYIGATTPLQDIAAHPLIEQRYTALAEAARSVATPQIRRMATLAGNLCQEPRCWYYRYPGNIFHCLRKGGDFCGALAGENRFHSIFGGVRVKDTPCTTRCPASTLIPEYMGAIRAGNLEDAARILMAANPIPFITGRVCPHFCQDGCNRKDLDESVSIREVERSLGDYILEHGEQFYQPPRTENGKHIAIIGSGPAGLAAAFDLRQLGYAVTVYERLPEPGGMLRYAIPEYRLPLSIVTRLIRLLEGMGVVFRCEMAGSPDLSVDALLSTYDAVLMAAGAWGSPSIGIEGEQWTRSGLGFLKEIRSGLRSAPGKRVVVIGGGNVAVDVAVSARRMGTSEVTMVCLEKIHEMPAAEWELNQALEEQVKLLNSWGLKRVITSADKVVGVELVRCLSVFNEQGSFAPSYDPQTTLILEADAVMMAVGQRPEMNALPAALELERGCPMHDPTTGASSLPGLYLAGDLLRPGSVIEAVTSGKRSALGIHAELSGKSAKSFPTNSKLHTFDPAGISMKQGAVAVIRPPEQRKLNQEDLPGLSPDIARKEALRCLNCGCVAVSPSDTGPVLVALDAVIHTNRRTIPAGEFFAARVKSSTVLEQGELVVGVFLPRPTNGSRSVYHKFRQRQSIDFPIVSVSVRLDISDGRIVQARAVLGAAAPTPVRAVQVEAFLEGKTIDDALAVGSDRLVLPGGAAAELALRGAIPMAENEYKIQLTKAFVRRAILACVNHR